MESTGTGLVKNNYQLISDINQVFQTAVLKNSPFSSAFVFPLACVCVFLKRKAK